jgi:branched-chain amino acid transport system permease protein
MEFVSVHFPNDTSIVVGIAFLVIVYLLPDGVTGRLEQLAARMQRIRAGGAAVAEKEPA